MKSIVQLQQQNTEDMKAKKPNLTGIPAQMKLNFEQRSGMSFDDVRVHYNSDKPAQLGALAYTQGTQIFVGPGHEQSLPHELGHVIQQKAGRVRPTRFIHGLPVNDLPELEREADQPPIQCMPAPALWGVIQMALSVMTRQKGCNCGYHALARALLKFNTTPGSTLNKDNIEIQLTSFAIEKGYSVIGEAFDPDALAKVGNDFCTVNHIPAVCSVVSFTNKDQLENILDQAKADDSVTLVPYFDDPNCDPVVNNPINPQENAHWSAIDTEKAGSYKLYEGNWTESDPLPGDTFTKRPALAVDAQTLFDSNQSILANFNWDTFFRQTGLPYINREKKNVVVDQLTHNRRKFTGYADFGSQAQAVMHKINLLHSPAPGYPASLTQNVSLKGKAVVVKGT